MNKLQAEFEKINLERNDFENRLQKIYNSRAWKLLRHYYIIRDKFPIIKIPLKIIKPLLKTSKHLFNTAKKSLPQLKSKLVIKSNTVIYVDHSFHKKTASNDFLINYLKKYFQVKITYDESWQGKPFTNLSFINQSNKAVIFWQNLPTADIFNNIDNDNIIFFPMYDMMLGQPKEYWLQYKNLKVINFSKTLHNQLQEWGINSTYIQYFPKPLEFSPGKPDQVYFWQRITDININLIPTLFPDEKLKVHLHTAVDPQQKFVKPTKQQEKKYHITYSNWFKTRQQAQELIKKKGIYIAPRFYEGIGLSFLEAMAMGKAVVAVNNPTMNEYISNNITGYLYNPNNPTPITLKNVNLIQKNAYQYISKGYKQWQKNKYKIIKIIKQNKISNNDES